MSEFWIYFEKGLRHILDPYAYDHILFLIALSVPYAFKDWARLLLLVTIFTIGHSLALLLSVFGVVIIKGNLVDFLIPVTILIVALFHLFTGGQIIQKREHKRCLFACPVFWNRAQVWVLPLSFKSGGGEVLRNRNYCRCREFALGIEAAQVIVVFVVLILSYIVQTFLPIFEKRLGIGDVIFHNWRSFANDC